MSWILPEGHDHDEDGNCVLVEVPDVPPAYRLQLADLVGIGILTVSNLTGAVANAVGGFHNAIQGSTQMLAREFFAHANARREQQQALEQRRLLMDDLRSLERGEHEES